MNQHLLDVDLPSMSPTELEDLKAELDTQRSARMNEFRRWTEQNIDADQTTRARDLSNGVNRIDEALAAVRAERVKRVTSSDFMVETGDGAAAATASRAAINAPNINRNRYSDPWDYQRSGSVPSGDLRGRALAAVERSAGGTDENRQLATLVVEESTIENDPAGLASRWAIGSSSPAYLSAFHKFARDPEGAHYDFDAAERAAFSEVRGLSRAMGEGSVGAGGAMVPQSLDPAIILTNNGMQESFRQVSTVKRIATQTWSGVTSAGVTAEWTAEAAEAADASPTLAQPTITPVRGDAWLQASFEFTDDTSFTSEISALMADARANLEGTAFAVGTGSTQPKGIVTALQLVTASRVAGSSGAAGAADFVLADVYALDDALPARAQANASWMGAKPIYNKVRRFGEGTVGGATLWTDLGPGQPPSLLGHSAYVASGMDSTITSGSNDDILVLGDFRHFYIVDNVGSHIVYDPLVKGANRRPTGEVGWFYFWRTGSDCVNPSQFRMLRI